MICARKSTVQCFGLNVSFLYLFMCLFSGLGYKFSKAATPVLYSLCIVPDFIPHTEKNWGMFVRIIMKLLICTMENLKYCPFFLKKNVLLEEFYLFN